MKDIVIIGAGGCAREVQFLIERINKTVPTYHLLGFVDEQLAVGSIVNGIPVIGGNDFLIHYPKQLAVAISIGSGHIREILYQKFKINPNLTFPNLIDPSVIDSNRITLGIGNIICAGCILTVNIQISDFVVLNLDCTISHDCILDSFVTVSPGTNVAGNVHIHSLSYLGISSTVIQGKIIGRNTTIGAGAVVVDDIPANCTAVGVPAKPIKFLS